MMVQLKEVKGRGEEGFKNVPQYYGNHRKIEQSYFLGLVEINLFS